MTSLQLKDRLLSLKNITEHLRQSTHSPNLNMNHLRTLIHDLKQISNRPSSPRNGNTTGYSRFSPSRQNSEVYERTAFHKYENAMKAGEAHRIQEQNATEQQIIALRQENLRLEQKLSQMRAELAKRQKQESEVKSDKNQSELPYFRHSEIIKAFVCRFQIAQSQYSKIEYFNRKIDLHLDKIEIFHKQKGTVEEFDITTLEDVVYLPGNTILYRLREFVQEAPLPLSMQRDTEVQASKPGLTNIFLKFQSEEQLKKWDLSIYSNYQLSSNLTTCHPFKDYFQRLRTHKELSRDAELRSSIESSLQLNLLQQKELLQFYLKKKDQYVQVKNMLQDKIPISRQASPNASKNQRQPSENNVDKNRGKNAGEKVVFDLANNYINDQPPPQPMKEPQQPENTEKIPDYLNSPYLPEQDRKVPERNNIVIQEDNNPGKEHRFSFSKEKESHEWEQQHLWQSQQPIRNNHNSSNGNMLSTSPVSHPFESALYRIPEQDMTPLKVIQNRVASARKNLQTGYEATKYSKDGLFSHQKKVFLSLDCKKLCWCEKDRQSDYKSIPLKMITKVTYGIVGEGIVKHVTKFDSRNYCVIEYLTGDYKKKTFELGATPKQMRSFAEQLQIIIEYNKKQEIKTIVES